MIEIAIKIAQKPNDEGVVIGFVPKIGENTSTNEHVYASIIYKILVDVVGPTIGDFTKDVGGKASTLTGDKAIFQADQLGWLPDAPQEPEKN